MDDIEKTTITLEDNQAAVVINDEGGIQFYVRGNPEDPESSIEPHELIILAFSFMYVHDLDRVVKVCQEWLKECEAELN